LLNYCKSVAVSIEFYRKINRVTISEIKLVNKGINFDLLKSFNVFQNLRSAMRICQCLSTPVDGGGGRAVFRCIFQVQLFLAESIFQLTSTARFGTLWAVATSRVGCLP
jgi:hypothetical protein